jgi:hypothetical protein
VSGARGHPDCTAEALYWRDGLRWQVILQIMYYADERHARGVGPFFKIGRTWTEAKAARLADEANGRLARSEREMAEERRKA